MRVQFWGDRLLYCDDNIVRITQPKTMFKKEEIKEIKVSELSSAKIIGKYQITFYDDKGKLWDSIKFTDKDYLSMANKIVNLIGTESYDEIELKTAEEMYQYCKIHGYGDGWNDKWGVKHFKLIERNLLDNERVLLVFMGLYKNATSEGGGNYAFAITDKRILLAQQKVVGEIFKIISLDMINDVGSKKGLLLGDIEFDTLKETFRVTVSKEHVTNILNKIHEIIFDSKEIKDNSKDNNIDKLRDLKSLLDEGILTEEEFENEKKKVLG